MTEQRLREKAKGLSLIGSCGVSWSLTPWKVTAPKIIISCSKYRIWRNHLLFYSLLLTFFIFYFSASYFALNLHNLLSPIFKLHLFQIWWTNKKHMFVKYNRFGQKAKCNSFCSYSSVWISHSLLRNNTRIFKIPHLIMPSWYSSALLI